MTEQKLQAEALRLREAELKQSQDELLLALDVARMGSWRLNLHTNSVIFSKSAEAILGYSPGEFPGTFAAFLDAVHPDDRAGIMDSIAARLNNRTGSQHRHQFRVVLPEGLSRWMESQGKPYFDPQGNPLRIIGVITDITERKQGEIALQEAEERFRVLATQAPVGIFQADERGRNTFVNQRWCDISGLTVEETLRDGWSRAVHPDDLAGIYAKWEASIRTNQEYIDEFRLVRKNGDVRWVVAAAHAIRDAQGNVVSHIGTVMDVTERKEAEQRFRGIYEQSPLGIALIDSHSGRFLQINPRYEQIIGRSEEEMVRLTFQEITHPDDLAEDLDNMALLRRGEIRRFQMEKRLLRGDGSLMWVSLTVVPMWRAEESPSCHLAMVEDITERKETEDKLRLRESQLTGILDNTPAVVYLKDSEGRYLLTNRRFQTVCRIQEHDIIGKTDRDIFPETIARSFQEADAKVWQEQSPLDFEETAPHADGPHTYRSVKYPVRDETGKMFLLGGIATDISDLIAALDALKQEQELLRNLIEVQEKERQFLCHEFHDGLIQYAVGSLMSLSSYQDKHPTSEAAATIDMVIGNLQKGVEDGRRVIRGIRPAVLDDSGIEAAVEDLIGQYANSGIHVTSKCDPEIGRLPESIQTTVYRVIQEALNNARKHSGTDVVRIELKKDNGDLHLEIRDFGHGFDVESARKKGFGLLGMTERVRLLGGECLIQSEQDAGTRIFVRLPIPVDGGR